MKRWFILHAALPRTLRFYRDRCFELGASSEQIVGITLLIERVERFQAANPGRCKVADVDVGTPAGDAIVAPNAGV